MKIEPVEVWLEGGATRWMYTADQVFQLERELAEAQAEIVRLKGEAESWEKVFDRTCEHLADAKTELAEAKKDAKRYRWLRDNTCKSSLYEHCGIEGYDTEVMISGEVLDAAIDEALKEGK
jgi:hypothetical protein